MLMVVFPCAGTVPTLNMFGPRFTKLVVDDCNTSEPPLLLEPFPEFAAPKLTIVATTPVASALPVFTSDMFKMLGWFGTTLVVFETASKITLPGRSKGTVSSAELHA